jgi:uncharacterized FlaG/YvyC family protein
MAQIRGVTGAEAGAVVADSSRAAAKAYANTEIVNSNIQVTSGELTAKVESGVEKLNAVLSSFDKEVSFEYDKELNVVCVKTLNANTSEVIKQLPPEEMLSVLHRINDALGLLINGTK